jgi:hypothetical protein
LIIQPAHKPRAGWDEAFAEMAARGDDFLLDAEAVHTPTQWEQTEWADAARATGDVQRVKLPSKTNGRAGENNRARP